jgi:tRNA pseudouridine13 synthase
LLYKENRDTMEVMNLLPRLLNARGKNVFSFAGTKDRRAVTVQRCSALRVSAERLAGLNKGDNGLRGCKLGNFVYKPSGLMLGNLGGNEFHITLRECVPLVDGAGLEEIVRSAMERVKKSGFINYFGLQRFGSFGVGTWEVGVEMLKGSWRGAVEKILDYDPALLEEAGSDDDSISSEDRCRAEACAAFLGGYELEKAASLIPRRSTAESCILRAFNERGLWADQNGNKLDYRSALQAVPRNLRTMYLHAYQSYVWNHVVSERIRWGADKVMEGDLVIAEEGTTDKKQPLATTEAEAEVDQDGEVIINAPTDDQTPGDSFKRARPLTKEEAESGEFAMTDIVLPTPGWDVVYPKNALMDVYKDIMTEHGLDPLNMKRNVKEISLPGSYRKVLGTFIHGEGWWEVKKYRGLQQLVQTDLEKINEATAVGEGGDKMEVDVNGEEEGEEKSAVLLGLRLGTSTYATMALRELMKGGVKAYVPEFGRGETRKKVE